MSTLYLTDLGLPKNEAKTLEKPKKLNKISSSAHIVYVDYQQPRRRSEVKQGSMIEDQINLINFPKQDQNKRLTIIKSPENSHRLSIGNMKKIDDIEKEKPTISKNKKITLDINFLNLETNREANYDNIMLQRDEKKLTLENKRLKSKYNNIQTLIRSKNKKLKELEKVIQFQFLDEGKDFHKDQLLKYYKEKERNALDEYENKLFELEEIKKVYNDNSFTKTILKNRLTESLKSMEKSTLQLKKYKLIHEDSDFKSIQQKGILQDLRNAYEITEKKFEKILLNKENTLSEHQYNLFNSENLNKQMNYQLGIIKEKKEKLYQQIEISDQTIETLIFEIQILKKDFLRFNVYIMKLFGNNKSNNIDTILEKYKSVSIKQEGKLIMKTHLERENMRLVNKLNDLNAELDELKVKIKEMNNNQEKNDNIEIKKVEKNDIFDKILLMKVILFKFFSLIETHDQYFLKKKEGKSRSQQSRRKSMIDLIQVKSKLTGLKSDRSKSNNQLKRLGNIMGNIDLKETFELCDIKDILTKLLQLEMNLITGTFKILFKISSDQENENLDKSINIFEYNQDIHKNYENLVHLNREENLMKLENMKNNNKDFQNFIQELDSKQKQSNKNHLGSEKIKKVENHNSESDLSLDSVANKKEDKKCSSNLGNKNDDVKEFYFRMNDINRIKNGFKNSKVPFQSSKINEIIYQLKKNNKKTFNFNEKFRQKSSLPQIRNEKKFDSLKSKSIHTKQTAKNPNIHEFLKELFSENFLNENSKKIIDENEKIKSKPSMTTTTRKSTRGKSGELYGTKTYSRNFSMMNFSKTQANNTKEKNSINFFQTINNFN